MHHRLFKRETMVFLMFLLPAFVAQGSSVGLEGESLILFGDTHVHSQYSVDAFSGSLPIKQGARGAYPPADACDYARYVSQLDFYFLTDHAESYLPEYWQDAISSVQRCSETQDGYNSGLVGFIGWFYWLGMEPSGDHGQVTFWPPQCFV